jgi:hypothetical protein
MFLGVSLEHLSAQGPASFDQPTAWQRSAGGSVGAWTERGDFFLFSIASGQLRERLAAKRLQRRFPRPALPFAKPG